MRAERIPQIIAAAMTVFAWGGFAQARMEDIAQEAGLSKATLYLYFASKEAIIAAILQSYFERGFDELAALDTSAQPVTQRLISWTRRRAQELQDNAAFLSIGFEFHALAARHASTREVVQGYYVRYRSALAALLAQAMEWGELENANADELAVVLISLLEGLTVLWMLNPAGLDLSGVAERAVHTLLNHPPANSQPVE
jgi:AcrR family transcriptional regulator